MSAIQSFRADAWRGGGAVVPVRRVGTRADDVGDRARAILLSVGKCRLTYAPPRQKREWGAAACHGRGLRIASLSRT